jgi:hypothetical protein
MSVLSQLLVALAIVTAIVVASPLNAVIAFALLAAVAYLEGDRHRL